MRKVWLDRNTEKVTLSDKHLWTLRKFSLGQIIVRACNSHYNPCRSTFVLFRWGIRPPCRNLVCN